MRRLRGVLLAVEEWMDDESFILTYVKFAIVMILWATPVVVLILLFSAVT